jgi:hypothetical protein
MTRTFKVKTEDTILFISRVFVLEGEDKQQIEAVIKQKYPNSIIKSVEEVMKEDER